MVTKKRGILLILFITLLLSLGCNLQNKTEEKRTVSIKTENPQEVLVKEISSGKLVEVYEGYVRLARGETKDNWIIIKNVRETEERFRIYPCDGCNFGEEVITIPSGEYKIISFKVMAEEGQKDIKVKDSNNNAYGFAKISVIVE